MRLIRSLFMKRTFHIGDGGSEWACVYRTIVHMGISELGPCIFVFWELTKVSSELTRLAAN
jgi:hypothetical protein